MKQTTLIMMVFFSVSNWISCAEDGVTPKKNAILESVLHEIAGEFRVKELLLRKESLNGSNFSTDLRFYSKKLKREKNVDVEWLISRADSQTWDKELSKNSDVKIQLVESMLQNEGTVSVAMSIPLMEKNGTAFVVALASDNAGTSTTILYTLRAENSEWKIVDETILSFE